MKGTPQERFEANYTVEPSGHWLWTGTLYNGRPKFGFNRKLISASRFSWQLHKGEIPEGMLVLHKPECNNKLCICPDHLYLGTQMANVHDAMVAGTFGACRLNRGDVVCIKKMFRGNQPLWLIAWIYQVTQTHLRAIRRGKYWKGVTV